MCVYVRARARACVCVSNKLQKYFISSATYLVDCVSSNSQNLRGVHVCFFACVRACVRVCVRPHARAFVRHYFRFHVWECVVTCVTPCACECACERVRACASVPSHRALGGPSARAQNVLAFARVPRPHARTSARVQANTPAHAPRGGPAASMPIATPRKSSRALCRGEGGVS
jgi:hypothetical protein